MAKVSTSKGELDESVLDKRTGKIDDEVELTNWIEHWHGGTKSCKHRLEDPSRVCLDCGAELVHRSASVVLKKMPQFAGTAVAKFK